MSSGRRSKSPFGLFRRTKRRVAPPRPQPGPPRPEPWQDPESPPLPEKSPPPAAPPGRRRRRPLPKRLAEAFSQRRQLRRAWFLDEPGPRFAPRDVLGQAVAGVLQRPGRWAVAAAGAVAALCMLLSAWSLHVIEANQVDPSYTAADATTVTVTDGTSTARPGSASGTFGQTAFPLDAEQRVNAMSGVVTAGLWWQVELPGPQVSVNGQSGAAATGFRLYAATASAVEAIGPTLVSGTSMQPFAEASHQSVMMVSRPLARELGIDSVTGPPSVVVDSIRFTVIGIYGDVQRGAAQFGAGAIIPATTALDDFGYPDPDSEPAQMLIATRLGAARTVAGQAALALRPDAPAAFVVSGPAAPNAEAGRVRTGIVRLLLACGAACLLIGVIVLAAAARDSAFERAGEFGLRRAMGARRRHVASQLLAETALIGFLAGLAGSALGVGLVVAVARYRHWSATLDTLHVVATPLLGAALGLAVGCYPALRTALTDPAAALEADSPPS